MTAFNHPSLVSINFLMILFPFLLSMLKTEGVCILTNFDVCQSEKDSMKTPLRDIMFNSSFFVDVQTFESVFLNDYYISDYNYVNI